MLIFIHMVPAIACITIHFSTLSVWRETDTFHRLLTCVCVYMWQDCLGSAMVMCCSEREMTSSLCEPALKPSRACVREKETDREGGMEVMTGAKRMSKNKKSLTHKEGEQKREGAERRGRGRWEWRNMSKGNNDCN